MKLLVIGVFVLLTLDADAQKQGALNQTKTVIGFELDALPYITGGYYASAWVGQNHLRYRAVITQIAIPDFLN